MKDNTIHKAESQQKDNILIPVIFIFFDNIGGEERRVKHVLSQLRHQFSRIAISLVRTRSQATHLVTLAIA